jgi:RNA polymerase-interacting CarD/CdnL/TRCF family regulator
MTERIEDVLANLISVNNEIRVLTAALARMEKSLHQSDEPLLRDALDTLRHELMLLQQYKGELIQRLAMLENSNGNANGNRAADERPMPIP